MHGERRTTENLREMRNSRAEEERITMKTHLQIKWKLSILFEHCFPMSMRKQTFLPIMLWTRQRNSPNHTNARNLSSFSLQQHLSLAYEILRWKEVLREALQNPLNKSHRHQLMSSNMSFLLYLKKYTRPTFLSQGFTRPVTPIPTTHKRRTWLTIYSLTSIKSFRIGIHFLSAWTFM